MTSITIRKPDDLHLHVRDGEELKAVVGHTARQFSRAIIMPNLKPPITTCEQALQYRLRIIEALADDNAFEPLMTLYLTDNTDPQEIKLLQQSEHIHAVKYYPAGATTNSDSGVTNIELTYDVLSVMEECDVPLLLHGEVTDADVDVFDREAKFIDTILEPLRKRFPNLKIVFEHITTKHAVDYVYSVEKKFAATITPQHCLLNRNALFEGGIRPHRYCLPILKAEQHREAIFNAATGGDSRFFLGTDSAPHSHAKKESDCGCAGIYSAFNAIELYAEIFSQADAMDKLENFASKYGAEFYGLPLNEGTITIEQTTWTVPKQLPLANTYLIPFAAGEEMRWKTVTN